jgi:hypothetical protein
MSTLEEIAQVVAVISAAYPNFNATEQTVEVYYQTLRDIPGDLLKAATLQAVAEAGRKFAPSVGELRGTVADIQKSIHAIPSSYEAWQEVQMQIVDNGGDFGHPVFSHALVEKTVKAIGWRNLRMSTNQESDRARFLQCYDQFSNRFYSDAMMLPEVRGYIEANGGKVLAPVDQMKQLTERMSVK